MIQLGERCIVWPTRAEVCRAKARTRAPVLLLCHGRARFRCVEDGAGEESFQAADRFAACLSFGLFAFEYARAAGW
jgi:hypothetical protein